ncbi:MAG: VanZ family protein [Chloroflexota bacterium]
MRTITFEFFAVLGLAVGCALLPGLWRARRSLPQLVFFSLFWGYLLLVVNLTLFPIHIDLSRSAAQPGQFMNGINPFPLDFSTYYSMRAATREAILNTLMTIPFGFLVPLVTPVRGWRALALVIVFGLGFETAQLCISLMVGFPYRVIDANDVVFNGLGALTGYIVFRLCAGLYLALARALRLRPRGLFAYLQRMALGEP